MTRQTELLEREAEEVRGDLAVDLDELRSRLTPGQIVDETLSYLRATPTADFGRNLVRDIREHPLPLLLIGAGIAWAIVATGRSPRTLPVPAAEPGLPEPASTRVSHTVPAEPATGAEPVPWQVSPVAE